MSFLLLLSERNVRAAERNHPDEFAAARRDFEIARGQKGIPFTEDEIRRIAALSVFVNHGLFRADTTPDITSSTTPRRKRKVKTTA